MRRLLTDAALRDGMARAARLHAAGFSWPATAAVVEAELRTLTGLPPRVPAARSGAAPAAEPLESESAAG